MTNRALLVGINKYPGSPLQGCVNDVLDMKSLLISSYKFSDSDVRVLVDAAATRDNIYQSLKWLMEEAYSGNRLLFHYSGHGTQMPTSGNTIEDAICPVDFDFSKARALTASDFSEIFSNVPHGVEFNWLSDSCYSGNLTRFLLPANVRSKYLPPPQEVQDDVQQILRQPRVRLYSFQTSSPLNGGFISGCSAEETSADASFQVNGQLRYNGAFTYFLIQELERQAGASLANLAQNIIGDLRRSGFSQTPQVKGASSVTSQAFLGGSSSAAVEAHASRLLSFLVNDTVQTVAMREELGMSASSDKAAGVDLAGATVKYDFKDVSVIDAADLRRLLEKIAPLVAEQVVAAKQAGKRDWSVTGTVSTTSGGTTATASGTVSGRDWQASVSGSATISPGIEGTATVSTGSQGTSGSIGISGTF